MVQERAVCPLCIWSRIMGSSKHSEEGFVYGDYLGSPAEVPVIQLRNIQAGPGRGHKGEGGGGFSLAGELSLSEALSDPAHSDFAEGLRSRLIDLVRDYVAEGTISPEDLTL